MLDHDWGREAFNRFPDLIERFDCVDSPYALWFELREEFQQAYKAPRNEDLISRFYAFADWCCSQPSGATAEDDLSTCVSVCFYEHIPELAVNRLAYLGCEGGYGIDLYGARYFHNVS